MKRGLNFLFFISVFIFCTDKSYSQNDTLTNKTIDSVSVYVRYLAALRTYLPEVQGTYLFAGKKSEMIMLQQTSADITNKTGRQVFAKVPGLFVYDMDGSGNQINIAARGLDPHRGWEFNIRKDGVLTNSDMYGYPASHYSMPLESIDHIELVRGTGSLQYGAEFGGMLNYVTKTADTTKPLSIESINSMGSYNLLSSYNALGGTVGKFQYYAYAYKKSKDGYRQNEHTDSHAENITLIFTPNNKLSVALQWSRSSYLYRIPGALTDKMFYADPTQATRSRNYFSPDIHVPSININWTVSTKTKIQFISSAVIGTRSSVMFDKPTNVADTINTTTLQYNNRQVDIDRFNSYTNELRLLQQYQIGKQVQTLVAGVQYMNNDLHRTQLGVGTTDSDYDLTLVKPGWGRDMHFITHNIALFAENKFQFNKKLSATVGAREEIGKTDLSGTIVYYPDNKIPVTINHKYPLFGVGFNYRMTERIQLYGGWSQSYRPMVFKDLIPVSLYEKVDANIKDSYGYNAEIGIRGAWKFLKWDINAFYLKINNRFGTLAITDSAGTLYTYRTNIGNSLNKGIEIFVEGNWLFSKNISLTAFTSTAFMNARYKDASVKLNFINTDVSGNKVESAPDFTTRNSIVLRVKKLAVSALYSYVSETFADALNTVTPPPATGATGLVPSYGLVDLNMSYNLSKTIELKMNINNLMDKKYFTKRPMFYPGPGVWPSEGRSMVITLKLKI